MILYLCLGYIPRLVTNQRMIERFLMHPLLVEFDENDPLAWTCHTNIPDKHEYTIIKTPSQRVSSFDSDLFEEELNTWLCRRNMNIVCSHVGILDYEKKKILKIDMIAEHNNNMVFFLTVLSSKRLLSKRKEILEIYGRLIVNKTESNYGIKPILYIMNIYENCRIYTSMIQ